MGFGLDQYQFLSSECVNPNNDPCDCVFPFKYNGDTFNSCTDVDEAALWCAVSVNESQEYTGDYGWCTEEKTVEATKSVCEGKCEKANQRCEEGGGETVCKCLEGYHDGETGAGQQCRCVFDWTGLGIDGGRRGDICQQCTPGYELKTWINKHTKKQKQWCHREVKECESEEQDSRFPNIERIGQGYNILIGNLLELPETDNLGHMGYKGLHKRIFSPYSVSSVEAKARCKINGYIMDTSKDCKASLTTTVFSNSRQVAKKIEDKVKTGETVEELSFSVSEGENAQFSNSVSFGESFTQSSDSTEGSSSNHCVDESLSESIEKGTSIESSTTSEASNSFDASQSESHNEERSKTSTQSTSSAQSASLSAGGGAFGFSFSASGETSSSEEKSKSDTFTSGKTSEYSFSRSSSQSKSATFGNTETNSNSNSKSITTNICKEGSKSITDNTGEEQSKDTANETNKGSSFEKSFEIPGDARSVKHSTAVAKSEEFFQEYSGSISHTEASCKKYTARLNDQTPPAFTNDFKQIIQEMDDKTEQLWETNFKTRKLENGKLISFKNEKNENEFDALFEKFIENYGTHYIREARMGGILRIKSSIKSLKEDEGNTDQIEKCLNKSIKEKRGDASVQDGSSNDNCNNRDIEEKVKSALETTELHVETYGAGANEDIYQWTNLPFVQPTLLPEYKLQPIGKLFTPTYMNRGRITRKDGTMINFKRILSWFMPRYAILTGRCKLMKNHHISEGKSCKPNKDYLVSTRDGNSVTHLAELCRSLPSHLLGLGATDCGYCPDGVDHKKRKCKKDPLKLYQQKFNN